MNIPDKKTILLMIKILEYIEKNKISEEQISEIFNSKVEPIVESKKIEESSQPSIITEARVFITTLASAPEVMAKVGDENVIYVESCECIPNFCGSAKIEFMGSSLYMNICDLDNVKKINLNLALEGKMLYDIPFVIKEKKDTEAFLQITEDLLCRVTNHLSS